MKLNIESNLSSKNAGRAAKTRHLDNDKISCQIWNFSDLNHQWIYILGLNIFDK